MKKTINISLNNLACSFIGTVLLMAMCFEEEYQSDTEKSRLYWLYSKISKNPKKYFATLEDTWNIDKVLEVFDVKRTKSWQVCIVSSDKNTLLCPYVIDTSDENEHKIIPLTPRPDGMMIYTLKHAKQIVPVNW